MFRTLLVLFSLTLLTACTSVPSSGQSAADLSQDTDDTDLRQGDIARLNDLAPLFRAASRFHAAAAERTARDETAAWFVYLSEFYDVRAAEVDAFLAHIGGDTAGDGEGGIAEGGAWTRLAAARDGAATEAGLLDTALRLENSVINELQQTLASSSVSVETKTFVQLILPDIRTTRDALSASLSIPAPVVPEGALADLETARAELAAARAAAEAAAVQEGEDAAQDDAAPVTGQAAEDADAQVEDQAEDQAPDTEEDGEASDSDEESGEEAPVNGA